MLISPCGKFYFDEKDAQRYVDFFPTCCTHVKGKLAGKPYELMPWIENDIIRPLFGWKRVEDGLRQYREAYIQVSRKNSKTLTMAGVALALTAIDGELGAEVYVVSKTEEQAQNLFQMAKKMIKNNAHLSAMFIPLADRIYHPATDSYFICLSGTASGKTGFNPSAVIIDEYHEFDSDDVVENLITGMAAREQPLVIYITTAGENIECPCYEEYEKAKKILAGDIARDDYLAVIYEAPPGSKIDDVEAWKAANPGWGMSVNPQYMQQKVAGALGWPTKEAKIKQFHLNQWGQTAVTAIPPEKWDACLERYKIEDLLGRPCWGGLDLATRDDMCSFALVFPIWEDVMVVPDGATIDGVPAEMTVQRKVLVFKSLVWYWVPEETVKTRKLRGFKYPKWVQDKLLFETAGDYIDYEAIREFIKDAATKFDIRGIGFDPYNTGGICPKMITEDNLPMIQVNQTMLGLSPATKFFETLVKSRRFRHNGHEVLNWNARNLVALVDNKENVMYSKKKSKDKIDGIASILDGMALAVVAPPEPPPLRIEYW